MSANQVSDYDAVSRVIQEYLDAARSGRGKDMQPAFHQEATIFGYIGDDLFSGPIEKLFAWNDENGPAKDLLARVTCIDLADTVATARLELDDWTGQRFTDLLTLLKTELGWKITNKVFHLHA